MSRYAQFEKLKEHPLLGDSWRHLSIKDRVWCRDFILAHEAASDEQFRAEVSKIGLDYARGTQPDCSVNAWSLLTEIIPPVRRKRVQSGI